jgi:transitional endoplasmic reticulum ATPase
MRREGISLKRAILLHGPYGTGKTSTGQLTALEATANGWTFISAKAGRDKPEDVLRTARLYMPAVVFVEDIDTATSSGESQEVTKFLDAFDGIASKGGELIAVMTTNHISKIHKGMLRPGRLDAVVEIAALDRPGIERLIKAVVAPSKLAEGVDYDAVAAEMDGFLPAFIRESITRAVTFAIGRLEGATNYTIDTPDLVRAAHSLKPQLAALNDAGEGVTTPTLDLALAEVVRDATKSLQLNAMSSLGENPTFGDKAED